MKTKVIFFVLLVIMLYGPKIGVLDISVLSGILGLIYLSIFRKQTIYVHRSFRSILLVAFIILIYSVLVFLLKNGGTTYFVLKFIKILIVTLTWPFVVYNYPIKNIEKIELLVLVLLVNAFFIFVEIIFPHTQLLFRDLYGFNKSFKILRAFGLTSGFDSAGFFSIIGFILTSTLVYYFHSWKYLMFGLFFFISVFLTSRTSIVIGIFSLIVMEFIYLFRGKKRAHINSIKLFLFPQVFALALLLFIILEISLRPRDSYFINAYSNHSLSTLVDNHIFLPKKISEKLLGTGVRPRSDIGYIITIHIVGFSGLSLILFHYFYIYHILLKFNRKKWNNFFFKEFKAIYWALFFVVSIEFVFNLKNLYFYGRGHYEIILLLLSCLLAFHKDKAFQQSI